MKRREFFTLRGVAAALAARGVAMARGGKWTAVRPAAGLSRLHPRCDRIGVLARNNLKHLRCLAGPCFAVAAVGGWIQNKRPPGGGRSQPSLVYAICKLWFFSGKERMRCPVALK